MDLTRWTRVPPRSAQPQRGFRRVPDAAIDFDSLPTYTDEDAGTERFIVGLPFGLGRIAGKAELHQGDVYLAFTARPSLMTDAKARELIVDALCKGRRLGMRRTFAKKLRTAIEN